MVTLETDVHNNGGYGPVDVSIAAGVSAPPDCSATPDPGNPTSASLPVSTDVVVDEQFTIHCSERCLRTFTFHNHITAKHPHIHDPQPANNEQSRLCASLDRTVT